MPKMTEAQRAAQAKAEEAIMDLMRAYNRIEPDCKNAQVITYAVVVERMGFDDDGEIGCEHLDVITSHEARLTTTRGMLLYGSEGLVSESERDV